MSNNNNDSCAANCPSNPHALDNAQDPSEQFEVMHPPSPSSSSFDPYHDRPTSTKTIAARSHVHKNKLWHCSVHIWIVDTSSQKILLQKRSMSKDTFPGRWDISSAGHVEAGKTLIETVKCELAEELGLDDVNESELKLSFVIPAEQADMGGCNAFEHVYFLVQSEEATNQSLSLGTAEVSEVSWKSIDEVCLALKNGDDDYAPRSPQYVTAMEKELSKMM